MVWLMFLQGIFGYMTLRRTLKIWVKTLKNLVKSIKNLEIALNFDQENEWQACINLNKQTIINKSSEKKLLYVKLS